MKSPRSIRWTAGASVAGAHGLLVLGLAAGLSPTTDMAEPPVMSVELAQVRGGQLAPRAPEPPRLKPPQAEAAQDRAKPRVADIPPSVSRPASTEPAKAESEAPPHEAAPAPAFAAAAAPQPPAPPRPGVATGMDVAAAHGAGRDYSSKLRSWLEAHKTYPKRSRMRREEGVVEVRFVIDRAGHVLDGEVIRASGHPVLDAEVLAMLTRADPFPPAPRHVSGERIEISAPVEFSLDR